jgi:hypothetical protein
MIAGFLLDNTVAYTFFQGSTVFGCTLVGLRPFLLLIWAQFSTTRAQ